MRRLALLLLFVPALASAGPVPPFVTGFMRTLLDDPNAPLGRATLGLGAADSPTFTKVTASGNTINVATSKTPASASAAGTQGDVAWDADYLYVCVATNSWKRAAIAAWVTAAEHVVYAGENVIFAAEQVVYP